MISRGLGAPSPDGACAAFDQCLSMIDAQKADFRVAGIGWRGLALVAVGLLVVLWPAGLAGAATCRYPAPPCTRVVFTGSVGPRAPLLGCVRKLPICSMTSTFNANGVITPGITHVAGEAGIALAGAGAYKISFSVSATAPNQMSIFVDGLPVGGTTYGSGAGTQQNSGQAIIIVGAGGVVTVRNHSSAAAIGLQVYRHSAAHSRP